jgi:hypothetical protein
MSRLKGRVKVRWFDPTNGNEARIGAASLAEKGRRQLTTPGKNAAGVGDFVLVLESAI